MSDLIREHIVYWWNNHAPNSRKKSRVYHISFDQDSKFVVCVAPFYKLPFCLQWPIEKIGGAHQLSIMYSCKSIKEKKYDMEQTYIVVDGEGVLILGDAKEEINLKPGDIFKIPAKKLYSLKAVKTLFYMGFVSSEKRVIEPNFDHFLHILNYYSQDDESKIKPIVNILSE